MGAVSPDGYAEARLTCDPLMRKMICLYLFFFGARAVVLLHSRYKLLGCQWWSADGWCELVNLASAELRSEH